MEDLLTTKQVQDYLRVDRITVYRMLQDGRLKGIKIGQQWRFPQSEVERLLSGGCCEEKPVSSGGLASFPGHCVQSIQDLVADLGQIGALTVDLQGEPLTEVSGACDFCQLMLTNEAGQKACRDSWRRAAAGDSQPGGWITCHAGLAYTAAPIVEDSQMVAYFLVGQCAPVDGEQSLSAEHIDMLARRYQIDPQKLSAAAANLIQIAAEEKEKMPSWAQKSARTVEGILQERAGLMDRLQKISELSRP